MKKKFIFVFSIVLSILLCVGLSSCSNKLNFSLTFVVEDDVYEVVSIQHNKTIEMPNDPTKEGFIFDGWYWDNGEWNNPFTANSLLNAPLSKDMKVYAKFIEPPHTEHDFVDGKCVECGARRASEGLKLELNESGESYTVIGIGSCTDEEIVVPTTYNGLPVVAIADNAFAGEFSWIENHGGPHFTKIVLQDGIKHIGNSAFIYCVNLKEVVLPDSITYIGDTAFACSGIEKLVLPLGIKEATNLAFECCTSLKTVVFHKEISKISEYWFDGIDGLENIIVDEENPNYKSIDGSLYTKDGKTLVKYAVGKKDTTFAIPKGVTSIGPVAFGNNDPVLEYIEIPDSVVNVGFAAFSGCRNLKSVSIPEGVEILPMHTFSRCESLTSVLLPKSLIYLEASFAECASLSEIEFSGTQDEWNNLTKVNGWSGKREFVIKCIDGDIVVGLPSLIYKANEDGKTCTISGIGSFDDPNLVIPSEIDGYSVTKIGKGAFRGAKFIKTVVIPSGVTVVDEYAFYGCENIERMEISETVTSIGHVAFLDCKSLVEFVVDANNNYYKSVDGNLYNRSGNSLVCYAIGKTETRFDIPDGVTYIYYGAFENCTSLEYVTIPQTVTGLGNATFRGCSSLKSIYVPKNVGQIVANMFYGCSSLESIVIEEGITKIGSHVFQNCVSLQTINVPNTITAIGDYSFVGCEKLEVVNMSSNISKIGASVFSNCGLLKKITYDNTQQKWNSVDKNDNWDSGMGTYIVVCSNGVITKN